MDTIFNGLNDKILEMFTGWLENAVDIFLQFIENVLLNYDGLAGIALNAYNLFVILSGSLLVVICLTRVITMLIGEADGSQEANQTSANRLIGAVLMDLHDEWIYSSRKYINFDK